MSKLSVDEELIRNDFEYYSRFIAWEISQDIFVRAAKSGLELQFLKTSMISCI
ncbi:MAG: hypothetical protein GQF41_3992 [Candidatus Rifleibacterium amylolyticum]|nr:MAG: hypothetical protein GQF41_3992 [Candidatus Rifleibacterium amylolyticum]